MNYLKTNTVGVDTPIKRIQTALYTKLESLWNGKIIDGYGRIYKNKVTAEASVDNLNRISVSSNNNVFIPEYYVSENEYKEVLLDDSKDCIFFFNVGDNVSVNGTSLTVDCEIIFSANITSLKDNVERQDEEVRNDVFYALNRVKRTFTINEIVTGLNNVYSDFSNTAEKFQDMEQYHHFKIKGKLTYTNNCI